ncbi:ABC transporter ATP-binding protein [Marinicrinis sediminis]|uniref:ABC transporter ATP-binding protein n=1 Tax=Marinicrinis sediminis TaxID=1652465 RepID=A0ABW5R884_9BACL
MIALETKKLTLTYGEKQIIHNLDIELPKGKITVFVGSNGCGKSTLLRSLARLMKPSNGAIMLDGKKISSMVTKELAKQLAILPQGPITPEGMTVFQLVKQGRYPHQSWLQQWSKKDEQQVQMALASTHLTEYADQAVDSLSGGQRQRAWIAMTLAQNTDTILLDEPTTFLDMTHQIEILDLLAQLNQKEQRTIVMVLHDLNMACRYADHIVAIKDQGVYEQGDPKAVITERLVHDVFHLESKIVQDPVYGFPMCIPYSNNRPRARE